MRRFDPLSSVTDSLSACAGKIEEIRRRLLDTEQLQMDTAAEDALNTVDEDLRDACVTQLEEITRLLDEVSRKIPGLIQYESAWVTHTHRDDRE